MNMFKRCKCRSGLAIPIVLAFIFVATILGSTLIFFSRTRGYDSSRSIQRLQLIHLAQVGLNEALSQIKPLRMQEIIDKKGREWRFKVPVQKFGRSEGLCEVQVKVQGTADLEIVSTGIWKEKGGNEQKLIMGARLGYYENSYYESGYESRLKIESEWKFKRLFQKNEE